VGRVSIICSSRLTDEEFVHSIEPLNHGELSDLLTRITEIRDECLSELKEAIREFRETGIPSEPEWFRKCKSLTNIRNKHIMIVKRKLNKHDI